MNILFVTDFYKPHIGGVEKLFSSLAENLANEGHQVKYITWKYQKKLPSKENCSGVNLFRISAPKRLLFPLFALFRITKEAKKADLIHTSTYSSAIGAWVAGKLTGKKIILTVHEAWGDLWMEMPFLSSTQKRLFRKFEYWLLHLNFDQYIAVSDFTRQKLIEAGIAPEKIVRIYNGIDYKLPVWKDPGVPFCFCFFGRAGASKGLDILIVAAENFTELHPEVRFKFIVSPQDRTIFNQMVTRITNGKLRNYSSFLTELPHAQLEKEILSSNCIIIPSLCEGFGFTAVEASAMQIPLISSGMGALPEVTSGEVITLESLTIESLTEAMEDALHYRFKKIEIKKFTIEEFISNHISLYHQLTR